MKHWKHWAAGIGILACGAILGALCMRLYILANLDDILHARRPHPGKMFLERLADSLELDAKQREQLEPMAQTLFRDMDALDQETRPRRDKVKDAFFQELDTILTQEQKDRLVLFEKEMEAMRKNMGPPPPPGGPPHHGDKGPQPPGENPPPK